MTAQAATNTFTYTDVTGREQCAVEGPNGTFLVTSKNDFQPYEVWRNDSLKTHWRGPNFDRALEKARTAAGSTPTLTERNPR